MSARRKFVLDANAFIQSKRKFYAFDICPGYWDALIWHHGQGAICSIDRVAAELELGQDDLWQWAEQTAPQGFFASTDSLETIACYRDVISWVQAQEQFSPEAKAAFAGTAADAWLIAYAKATGRVLVTLEEFSSMAQKRVPIPNVCRASAVAVEYASPFEMLRRLDCKLRWTPDI